jgi:carbon monoxide dehydrogenase subunit G
MIEVEEAIEVARPPAAVYAFLSAVERYPDWLPALTAAEQTSPGPVAAGTTFRLRLAGPTGPIVADGLVVEADPDRSLTVRGDAPQGRVEGGLRLKPVDGGTGLDVRIAVELTGMYRFAEGLVAGELRRSMPGVLARVKASLEAEGA